MVPEKGHTAHSQTDLCQVAEAGACLGSPAGAAVSHGTSSCSVFHSSFGTGLQSSPKTDSSKVNELSKLFVHAFIVKGSKSQRMKEHELTSVNDVQDGEERNEEKLRYWSGETNIHTGR